MLLYTSLLAVLATSVNAHTIFQRVYVNGVDQGYLNGVRYPTYDGPITDVTSDDLICNGGPNPLVTPYSQTVINIPAGATVGAQWDHVLQPNGWTASDPADPIDPSHLGPVTVYLAKVPDATQTDVTGLGWFKISEDGLDGSTWAVTKLISAHGNQTFTIPECLEPGNYFLRAEIIALHAASSYPGAQFYIECAQINIVGSGTAVPATVPFPGTYKSTDPGITIDIYYPVVTDYIIPGPPVFTCSGSSGSGGATTTKASSTSSAHTTTATTSSTTKATTTSTKTTSTSSSPASTATGTVPEYGQCGGTGYSGSTTCAAGFTCTYSNAYYSQCL